MKMDQTGLEWPASCCNPINIMAYLDCWLAGLMMHCCMSALDSVAAVDPLALCQADHRANGACRLTR